MWVGHGPWHKSSGELTTMWAVTFSDNGWANLYLESSDKKDGALISPLAWTFRPLATKRSDSPMCDGGR